MFKDFKHFIMRGNVIDLAIGVIIGAAFGKIVTSLVNDILTPLISRMTGGVNLSGLHVRIGGTNAAPINISYGNFIQAAIDFLIISLVIYLMVRAMNKLQPPPPESAKPMPREEQLLTEIRDELRKK